MNERIVDVLWAITLIILMSGLYLNFLIVGPVSIAALSWIVKFVLGQIN